MLYWILLVAGRPIAWMLFRPLVHGRDRLPRGGFVVAPNHLSGWDSIAVAYALRGRIVRNMGKTQLFVRPLLGPVVRSLGAFPAGGGVETAARLVRDGQVVAIFPEGARRRADRVHQPRTGAARTALASGAPLVPTAIGGTDRWRRLGRWYLAFGDPVPLDDLRDLPVDDAAREATRRLWDAVTTLEQSLAR